MGSHPRDIFLLKMPDEFCDNKQQDHGVLVLNGNSLGKAETFKKRFRNSYRKNELISVENGQRKGWQSFVHQFHLNPINSIVLIDNYVLQNANSGKNNLIALFKSLLPHELSTIFHILIIIDNRGQKFLKRRLKDIQTQIQNELQNDVAYPVEVCIATHGIDQNFHSRLLISNYHLIKTDHGFDLFHENGKVKFANEQEFVGMYYTLYHDEGEPEIKMVSEKLEYVKKVISQIDHELAAGTNIIAGECNNRLLDDF